MKVRECGMHLYVTNYKDYNNASWCKQVLGIHHPDAFQSLIFPCLHMHGKEQAIGSPKSNRHAKNQFVPG